MFAAIDAIDGDLFSFYLWNRKKLTCQPRDTDQVRSPFRYLKHVTTDIKQATNGIEESYLYLTTAIDLILFFKMIQLLYILLSSYF